ncbi:MAG: carbohydrate ABC transporter permease [Chloroflexota bacterium]
MSQAREVTQTQKNLMIFTRYLLLILVASIFILPLIFMIMSSFKPDLQLLRDSSSIRAILPVGDLSFDNYASAFERVPIMRFIGNSLFVTATTVILSIVVNSMAAFSLAIIEWRGKGIILSVIIATLIIPADVIVIPMLMLVNQLPWIGASGIEFGWLNTYHVQIIPFIVDPLSIFLFYTYFKDLPTELVEAARIDGASIFQIFYRVIMPISGPVLATVAILKFLPMWNAYLWPLMVVQREELRPVMVGLQYFFQLDTLWGEIMAYLTIITVPVLLFYLSLQRAFIESIASTGIKG